VKEQSHVCTKFDYLPNILVWAGVSYCFISTRVGKGSPNDCEFRETLLFIIYISGKYACDYNISMENMSCLMQ